MQVNSGERMDVPGEEGSTVGVFPILTLKGSPFQLDFGCPPCLYWIPFGFYLCCIYRNIQGILWIKYITWL